MCRRCPVFTVSFPIVYSQSMNVCNRDQSQQLSNGDPKLQSFHQSVHLFFCIYILPVHYTQSAPCVHRLLPIVYTMCAVALETVAQVDFVQNYSLALRLICASFDFSFVDHL